MHNNIIDVQAAHHAAILAANLQYVDWLSPLEPEDLCALIAAASSARVIGDGMGIGVLIGFTADSPYQSDNLNWLRAKFDSFVYIDRVIVSQSAQGKGYGRRLYADLENFARAHGYPRLVCEVNTVPDNPGSHSFHDRMGFAPCGDIEIKKHVKSVRYYVKALL